MKKTLTVLLISFSCLAVTANSVSAETAYGITSATYTVGTEISSFTYAGSSDTNYNRVTTTTSGLDVTYTIAGVSLNSANIIYVNYDGLVCSSSTSCSSVSFPYEIQIRDFTNSTWRNIIPHATTLTNTTDSGVGLLTQFTAAVNSSAQFVVYNGFFTDGSNNPVSTPLSNFVNGSDEVQIRIYSSTTTANMEFRLDYLSVEPAIDNQLYPTNSTFTNGSRGTNEYNDLTTDDNNTNMTLTAGASGLDMYYSFATAPTPYTGANTILVEYSGSDDASIASYRIYIRDFTNNQWDQLNGTNLNSASDATYYFATSTAQAVSDYISSGEIRIRLESASTSGTVTVDFLRVTIGSVATNSGFYVGTLTRGSTSSGTVTNTQTIDTTSANSAWVIATSNTDVRTSTEFAGDCNTATNHCLAGNIQTPVTLPANVQVTGIHTVWRLFSSNAALDVEFGIRSRRVGNVGLTPTTGTDNTTASNYVRTAAYPMPAQVGTDPHTTVPVFQPHEYVDTVNNSINIYWRTVASDTTSRTLTLDFAFTSIRYIGLHISRTAAWSSQAAGSITTGSNSASNARFATSDDNSSWVIAQSGSVVDAYMIFTGVAVPTNANKLIVHVQMSCSAANGTYELYIRDQSGATWRELTHHGGAYTCATGEAFHQFEVFNGYFSNGSGTPTSTPLSNFVSGSSEVWIRVLSASTANMQIDYGLVEMSIDPAYFPADEVITNGSLTSNDYNDLYTDDNNTNMVISNSSGIDFYYSFTNVATPPTGSNAAFLAFSGFHTGATSYNLYIYNFTSPGWEQVNGTALANTSDATNYFLYSISNWSNYISSNEMRIRVATTAAAGSVTIDYVKLVLGSVTTSGAGQTIDLGGTYYNSYSAIDDLDTSATFVKTTHAWGIRSYPNSQTARTYGAPSAVAGRIDFPLTQPANSYPLAIIWNVKGANSANTALTPTFGFAERKNYFTDVVNTFQPFTSATVPPTTAITLTLATSTQTFREGWHQGNTTSTTVNTIMPNVQQAIDNYNNEINFRFRTSASTSLTAAALDLDSAFVALRYVN